MPFNEALGLNEHEFLNFDELRKLFKQPFFAQKSFVLNFFIIGFVIVGVDSSYEYHVFDLMGHNICFNSSLLFRKLINMLFELNGIVKQFTEVLLSSGVKYSDY